jgi:LuxR family maltose regulon positive regulatory protein
VTTIRAFEMSGAAQAVEPGSKGVTEPSTRERGAPLGVPRLAALELPRARLVARVEAAARGPLTVVVAPAGWGKTTLVAQWARGHDGNVVWLDGAKSDAGMIAASVVDRPAGRRDGASSRARDGAFEPCYVVVDAADSLSADAQDRLADVIEHAPPHTHVVMTTRADLLFPNTLARLRARDDVAYLYSSDLAFDRDEAAALLRGHGVTELTADDLETLLGKTGGWPAALVLAAIAMRESENAHTAVEHFSGANARVRAYVHAEVVSPLPEALRTFMLDTAVIDTVEPSLSRALTDLEGVDAVIEALEAAQLLERAEHTDSLLYPLLVRDALRAELGRTDPDARTRLLERAAQWHIDRATALDIEQAGGYLVRAERWEAVRDHAMEYARLMHQNGRARAALAWVTAMPISMRRADAELCVLEVALLTLAGDTLRAEAIARELGDVTRLRVGLRLALATIRAVWVQGHLPPPQVVEAADEAVRLLAATARDEFFSVDDLVTPESTRTIALVARARARWYEGFAGEAAHAMRIELELGDTLPLSRLHVLGTLAQIEAWHGTLSLAERYASQAARIARVSLVSDHPFLVASELAHVHVLIERGDVKRAMRLLDQTERLTTTVVFEVWMTNDVLERAWLRYVMGSPRLGIQLITSHLARANPPARFEARARALTARMLLDLGEIATATHQLGYDPSTPYVDIASVAVQIALARQDLAAARRVLEQWPSRDELQDEMTYLLWAATVEFAASGIIDVDAADFIAAPASMEGHVRLFLDAGPDVRRYLVAVARRRPDGFFASLLRADSRAENREAVVVNAPTLSSRERTVLRHLANRLTYVEIAELLFISQNTVKSHAKSIYTKLGASGRLDAVERAEELGLL